MESRFRGLFLMLATWVGLLPSAFAEEPAAEGEPPETIPVERSSTLIEPFVVRADLDEADIDAQDIEVQVFWGQYSVEDFGVSSVLGVTLSYHISEDFFVEAIYGQSKVQSSSAEILGGFDLVEDDGLTYYNASVAWNIMPGETFMWRNTAFNSSLYLITGYGITDFVGEKQSTINFGMGYRLVLWDWLAFRLDFRDHLFRHELFVQEKLVNNFEMRTGVSVFF